MRSNWLALLIDAGAPTQKSSLTTAPLPYGYRLVELGDQQSMAFTGDWAYARSATPTHAMISANTLQGGGYLPAVAVSVDGDILMQGNRCIQPGVQAPAVELVGAAGSVTDNRLQGGSPTMKVEMDQGHLAVIGNLHSADILVGTTPVGSTGAAWSQLNPQMT
jgi:hypothetical protein